MLNGKRCIWKFFEKLFIFYFTFHWLEFSSYSFQFFLFAKQLKIYKKMTPRNGGFACAEDHCVMAHTDNQAFLDFKSWGCQVQVFVKVHIAAR